MTRRLAFSVALLLAAAAARADTFAIMAFGDSITDGYPYCLDDPALGYDGPCASANPAVPYPDQLRTLLPCTAPGCVIENRGCGGEQTGTSSSFCPLGGGVTRIECELDPTPDPVDCPSHPPSNPAWDVVLLSEGTNDAFNSISAATIAANLGVIDDKVTAAGVDTLHAAPPEASFSVPGPPFPPPGINVTLSALSSQLAALAAGRNRYFVDLFAALCGGNASCLATKYVDPLHPNVSGYDTLSAAMHAGITAVPVPGVPTQVAPSGAVCNDPPSFDFTKESPDRANWYEISIDNGGNLYDEWSQENDLCTGSDCSLATPIALGAGTYSWRLRGRNPRGHGAWSADESFEVVTTPAAVPSVLTSPAGGSTEDTPDFVWDEVAGATGYRLTVEDSGAGTVLDQTFDAGICTASVCTAAPGVTLPVDGYTWKVKSLNPCESAWSAAQAFGVLPLAPVPLGPEGQVAAENPTYRWLPSAGATQYELEVTEDASPQPLNPAPPYAAGTVCGAQDCFVTPTSPTLTEGPAWAWRVRASHPHAGSGPWSATSAMTKVSCDPTDPLVQEDQTVTSPQPIVRGCGDVQAGNLGGGDFTVDSGGQVHHHAGGTLVLYSGFTVLTGGSYTGQADG